MLTTMPPPPCPVAAAFRNAGCFVANRLIHVFGARLGKRPDHKAVKRQLNKLIATRRSQRSQSGGGATLSAEEELLFGCVDRLEKRREDEEEELRTRLAARVDSHNAGVESRNELLAAALGTLQNPGAAATARLAEVESRTLVLSPRRGAAAAPELFGDASNANAVLSPSVDLPEPAAAPPAPAGRPAADPPADPPADPLSLSDEDVSDGYDEAANERAFEREVRDRELEGRRRQLRVRHRVARPSTARFSRAPASPLLVCRHRQPLTLTRRSPPSAFLVPWQAQMFVAAQLLVGRIRPMMVTNVVGNTVASEWVKFKVTKVMMSDGSEPETPEELPRRPPPASPSTRAALHPRPPPAPFTRACPPPAPSARALHPRPPASAALAPACAHTHPPYLSTTCLAAARSRSTRTGLLSTPPPSTLRVHLFATFLASWTARCSRLRVQASTSMSSSPAIGVAHPHEMRPREMRPPHKMCPHERRSPHKTRRAARDAPHRTKMPRAAPHRTKMPHEPP